MARRASKSSKGKKKKDTMSINSFDKKWLIGGGVATFLAVVAITMVLIWYYTEPVVARVNNVALRASDIAAELLQAEEMYAQMYEMFFPEAIELDFDWEIQEGVTMGRMIKEDAVRQAAFTVVYLQMASDLGVVVSPMESDMIEAEINQFISEVGPQAFEAELQAMGFTTRGQLVTMLESHQIFDNLLTYILNSPEEFAQFEQFMPEEEVASDDRTAEALALLARLEAGEDFDQLMWTYNEDPGMHTNPDGYTFTSGQMVPPFENATRMLEVGEVSGLVESDFGIHIIQRVEPDPEVFFGEDSEVLGAKHILLMHPEEPATLEQRMISAIQEGLRERANEANIVFTNALDRLELGR